MFNLFKRTTKIYKPLTEYSENWAILKEERYNLIVRINIGYKDATGHPDYPIKMGVALPFIAENTDSIHIIKNTIEDTINDLLGMGTNGIVVAVITCLSKQKFIEFLSYTRNELDFQSIHRTLKEKFPDEDIQMYAEPDLGWKQFKSFMK